MLVICHQIVIVAKIRWLKVFRECKNITINNSEINSPEGFWDCENVEINNSKIESMYFLSRTILKVCNYRENSIGFSGNNLQKQRAKVYLIIWTRQTISKKKNMK